MVLEFELQDDICVLHLEGRFVTGADARYLGTKADEIKATGCRKILADFRHVPYIDSTGLAFVVGLYTTVTKSPDGGFVICGPGPRVREVLELTRLSTVIPVTEDLPASVAILHQTPKALRAKNNK
jgi:anti-anti-sigma factor